MKALALVMLLAPPYSVDDPVPANAVRKVVALEHKVLALDLAWDGMRARESENEIRLELAADVMFDFDRADLKPEAEATLAHAATFLQGKARVRIEGHTDSKGTAAYNQALSEKRARRVADWLRARGVTAAVDVKGLGATKPVVPNTTPEGRDDPEGRARNRRVEIVIAK